MGGGAAAAAAVLLALGSSPAMYFCRSCGQSRWGTVGPAYLEGRPTRSDMPM